MDYKWILIGLGILLVLILIYSKRKTIMGWFGKKSENVETQPKKYLNKEVPLQDDTGQEDYIGLLIASSPEEGKEIELGEIIVKLYDDVCPRTCENFRSLAKIEYKGCPIHRVVPGFAVQFGDYENGNGTGGDSIFGKTFPDESFELKHNKRGVLSMANKGPNTNGSQVFFTFAPQPHLDGKHVVFGEIVKGFDVLDVIENQPINDNDEPVQLLYVKNTRTTNKL